ARTLSVKITAVFSLWRAELLLIANFLSSRFEFFALISVFFLIEFPFKFIGLNVVRTGICPIVPVFSISLISSSRIFVTCSTWFSVEVVGTLPFESIEVAIIDWGWFSSKTGLGIDPA